MPGAKNYVLKSLVILQEAHPDLLLFDIREAERSPMATVGRMVIEPNRYVFGALLTLTPVRLL